MKLKAAPTTPEVLEELTMATLLIVMVSEMLAVWLLLSVTVIVMGNEPVPVGVPLICPLDELKLRPADREPLVRA